MTLVVDASVVVSALVDGGVEGRWAESILFGGEALAAPHLLHAEVANVLRRAAASGDISDDAATLAHADLLRLRIDLFDYEPLASRVWELRRTVTAYDAWYVALAESLGVRLATLDRRLARANGPGCGFLLPG